MPNLRLTFGLLLAISCLPNGALAKSNAGGYLAGRLASSLSDFQTATDYFGQSLASGPSDSILLENALLAELGAGHFEEAAKLAVELDALEGGSVLGDLAILVAAAKAGKFDQVLALLEKQNSKGDLINSLVGAWAKLGLGQMSAASDAFDETAKNRDFSPFALYHKALALALVGDFGGADAILSDPNVRPALASRGAVLAHVEVLSQLERTEDALKLLNGALRPDPEDKLVNDMRAELEARHAVPFTTINNATDGIAEVFLAVASAVSGDAATNRQSSLDSLLFARTAQFLRPDLTDAAFLIAGNLGAQGQHKLAIEALAAIPEDNPDYPAATIGRAEAMMADGQPDAAVETLQALSKASPEKSDVWAALGDMLRRNDRHGEAIEAYGSALALRENSGGADWPLYYARAISYERAKRWPEAEADFRKALELSPNQPAVLNYLGYSYLEQKSNLDEALDMIQRAARARPDDGAIADSLGWAYYRLGRFEEAAPQMERAIELMPVDPVVNDHLGDVFWMVGRKREAEFQWRRALSFKPETEAESDFIRRKLEVGLDAALADGDGSVTVAPDNGG
ncbi:MAG: tetratricopeptide repeat protein [Paracoccaceae bacterium]